MVGDQQVTLTWEPPLNDGGSSIDGYAIKRGIEPGRYNSYVKIGNILTYTDTGLTNGVTYYYAVSAYDYDGNESPLSRNVVYDIPRPEGYNVVLGNFHTAPAIGGYDFSDYAVVPFDDLYADMWYEYYAG